MNRYVSRGLWTVLITGGLCVLGAGVAQAAETSGDDGAASGNQAIVQVELPIDLSGNAVAVIGDAVSSGAESAPSEAGQQPAAPVEESAPAPAPAPVELSTGGDDSLLGGGQAVIDVDVPITIGGNAVSVVGDSSSSDSGTGAAADPASASAAPAAPAEPAAPVSSGDDSVAGGNQLPIDVAAPVTIGGNGIAVIGDAESNDSEVTTGTGGTGSGDGATTSGDNGIAGGNQVIPVIGLPVTIGGNGIAVIGDAESNDSEVTTGTGGTGGTGSGDGATTSGDDGIAGGNQVIPVIGLPVTIGGNGIAVIGDAESTGSEITTTPGGGSGDPVTGGDGSIGGGNQIIPVIGLPVTVGGNAVCVVGDCTTGGSTVTPTDPTDPTDPIDPTDPTDPTGPTDPTDPIDPTEPTNPVTPPTPGDPGTPATPVTPTDPGTGGGTGTSVPAGLGAGQPLAAGAASGSGSLALTGATPGLLVGGLALLLVLGMLMLLFARRNRTAE